MEIFIRGLVALGAALAVASFGFSQERPASYGPAAGVEGDTGGGWAPFIRNSRLLHPFGGGSGGCDSCGGKTGLFGKHHKPDPAPQAKWTPPPRTQPGTVVFPQHPFARSPRDYFMMD